MDKITAKLEKIEVCSFNINYTFSSINFCAYSPEILTEQICALSKTDNPIGLKFVICQEEYFTQLQIENENLKAQLKD